MPPATDAGADGSPSGKPMPSPFDLRQADNAYRSCPPFVSWASCSVETMRWDGYAARLEASGKDSPSLLKRAREVARRAAAIDTGAIEGLYEVDRGFTITVATQAAMWDAVLSRKGEQVRALIESQLDAYEYVMDLATEKTPVAEAWIRQLHSRICQGQDTFQAFTEVGIQQQPLPK